MKIDCIRTHHLRDELDEPFGFSQWYYSTRNTLWVEIIADDGTTGWGECYGPAEVYQAAITSFLRPASPGARPAGNRSPLAQHVAMVARFRPRRNHDGRHVRHRHGPLGPQRQIPRAVRVGVDGGTLSRFLPCYATGMYFKDMPEDALIDSLVAEAVGYRDQGLRGHEDQGRQESGLRYRLDRRHARGAAGRDAHGRLQSCLRPARGDSHGPRPGRITASPGSRNRLSPEYESQFRQLHDKIDVPIATGECEQTRYGFQRLLSPGGVQIAQPDLAYCGGISEALKIRTVASSLGVNVIPHCWGTMLNLAAATHFLASGYREPGRAEDGGAILELDRTPNPLRDELFETPVEIDRATVHVPTCARPWRRR
jgi:D-galactarolactone cycloisomerase